MDYVDSKSQSQTYFKSFSTLQKRLLISSLSWLCSWYAVCLLNIFHWWQIWPWGCSRLMVTWIWELVWIFHIPYPPNLSLCLFICLPYGIWSLRGKERIAIFKCWNKAHNLLPVLDQERHFKIDKYKEQTKFTEITVSHFRPRKIIFLLTYIKYKKLE